MKRAFWKMWGWPLALGFATAIGLVAGLFSANGPADTVAWILLSLPVGVALKHWFASWFNEEAQATTANGCRAASR